MLNTLAIGLSAISIFASPVAAAPLHLTKRQDYGNFAALMDQMLAAQQQVQQLQAQMQAQMQVAQSNYKVANDAGISAFSKRQLTSPYTNYLINLPQQISQALDTWQDQPLSTPTWSGSPWNKAKRNGDVLERRQDSMSKAAGQPPRPFEAPQIPEGFPPAGDAQSPPEPGASPAAQASGGERTPTAGGENQSPPQSGPSDGGYASGGPEAPATNGENQTPPQSGPSGGAYASGGPGASAAGSETQSPVTPDQFTQMLQFMQQMQQMQTMSGGMGFR